MARRAPAGIRAVLVHRLRRKRRLGRRFNHRSGGFSDRRDRWCRRRFGRDRRWLGDVRLRGRWRRLTRLRWPHGRTGCQACRGFCGSRRSWRHCGPGRIRRGWCRGRFCRNRRDWCRGCRRRGGWRQVRRAPRDTGRGWNHDPRPFCRFEPLGRRSGPHIPCGVDRHYRGRTQGHESIRDLASRRTSLFRCGRGHWIHGLSLAISVVAPIIARGWHVAAPGEPSKRDLDRLPPERQPFNQGSRQ